MVWVESIVVCQSAAHFLFYCQALEKSIKAQVDQLVNIMDSRSAALEEEIKSEKATVSTLIDRTTVL
ncbi:hypothetical protein DPMN_091937 [Dreissena polymorpha]|uniref:Uncharacterized protein n=1 Tax=Dreissena polymorpha TaxID=45954 RepID=A0A9D4L1F1_DREPO|nr:hypothetical protein DPMN_091937 [Dreissena polymorpha]